jgi:hypothetical protein
MLFFTNHATSIKWVSKQHGAILDIVAQLLQAYGLVSACAPSKCVLSKTLQPRLSLSSSPIYTSTLRRLYLGTAYDALLRSM